VIALTLAQGEARAKELIGKGESSRLTGNCPCGGKWRFDITPRMTRNLQFLFVVLLLAPCSGYGGPAAMTSDKNMVQTAPACAPRWYVSIGGGLDLDYQATDLVNSTSFLPFAGSPFTEFYRGHNYDDVYGDTLWRVQGEIGYVLTSHVELFALFKYSNGSGKRIGGEIDTDGIESFPLSTRFGDYSSWGGELGLRWFFFSNETTQPWRVRPYVSISGGATAADAIGVTSNHEYPGSFPPVFHGNLYNDTIVGTGALMLGLEVPVACHWSFAVEAGVRYESAPDASDDIRNFRYYGDPTTRVQNENYNNDGARLYCPTNISLKFRF
jgi:hypothetical protein